VGDIRAQHRSANHEESISAMRRLYPIVWTGAFLASALCTYWLISNLSSPEENNPTRDRIRALIDEADNLLHTLDDQRRA
jgi:hypothetical protein